MKIKGPQYLAFPIAQRTTKRSRGCAPKNREDGSHQIVPLRSKGVQPRKQRAKGFVPN